MSKFLIENAFKSLDEIMQENKQTLKESGVNDPAKQFALSMLAGYEGGKLVNNDSDLQIFSYLSKGAIREYADAINDKLGDYGKKLAEDSIIVKKDDGEDIFIGNYIFVDADDVNESLDKELYPWIMQQGEDGEPEFLGWAESEDDMLHKMVKDHRSDYIHENTYISELDKETYKYMKEEGDLDEEDIKALDEYFAKSLDESAKLEERIPKDLKKAKVNTGMRRSKDGERSKSQITKGMSSRRGAQIDFEKAEYKELTKDEAMKLLKDDKNNLQKMYFVFNDRGRLKLAAYDRKNICMTDTNIYERPYEKRSGDIEYRVPFWPASYVVERADKIYLSDEDNPDLQITRPPIQATDLPGSSVDKRFNIDGTLRAGYGGSDQQDTGNHAKPYWGDDYSVSHWELKKQLRGLYKKLADAKARPEGEIDQEEIDKLKARIREVEYSYNAARQKAQSKYPENTYLAVIMRKNREFLNYYEKRLSQLKSKAKEIKDDRWGERSEYSERQRKIKGLEEKIKELQDSIARCKADMQALQSQQTEEDRLADEEALFDRLEPIMNEFNEVSSKLNALKHMYKLDDKKKEQTEESLQEDANAYLGRDNGRTTVGDYRDFLQDAMDVVEGHDDDEEIEFRPNTYRIGVPFLGTYGGYIDVNDPDFVSDDEEEDTFESLDEGFEEDDDDKLVDDVFNELGGKLPTEQIWKELKHHPGIGFDELVDLCKDDLEHVDEDLDEDFEPEEDYDEVEFDSYFDEKEESEDEEDSDDEDKEDKDDELDDLIDDEDEAIEGYDEVIDNTDNEHLKDQLEHIKDEEVAHKEFLEKAKEDPDATYEHDEEEHAEEEHKEEESEEELHEDVQEDQPQDDNQEQASEAQPDEQLQESEEQLDNTETFFRIYFIDNNGCEDFYSAEETDITNDEECINKAQELYSNEGYQRVVATKIDVNPDWKDEEVSELWDSNDMILAKEDKEEDQPEDDKAQCDECDHKEDDDKQLNESKEFNLKDPKEVVDAAAYADVDDHDDEVLVAVDPSLESEDDEHDPHVGDALLQCRACQTTFTKKVEDLVKEEDSDIYNIEEKCPHCGATDGFIYLAQLSTPDSEDAKAAAEDEETDNNEEILPEKPVEEEPKETEEDNNVEDFLDVDIDEIKEESFDKAINDNLTRLYENIASYKTTDVSKEDDVIILEGILTSTKGKELKTTFKLRENKENNTYTLIGDNEIFKENFTEFKFNCKVEDNSLICESLEIK